MEFAERVDAVIDAALGSRIVGCVVLVNEGGKRIYSRAAGFADREAGKLVAEDTIFRLASVTKPIVAATALRMIDLGLLSLDTKVTDYLPYFTPKAPDGSTPDILVHHLLSHTSGLTYSIAGPEVSKGADNAPLMTLEENLRRLAKYPLQFAPGTGWQYGMSIDVLGGVLEAATPGSRLSEVILKHTTGPLGMRDTRFTVTDAARLAVPYGDGKPEPFRMAEPQAIVNENGIGTSLFSPKRIFQPTAPQSGGSGMAGTAGDLMTLWEALRTDFLKPETRDAALTNRIGTLHRDVPGQRFGYLGGIIDSLDHGWPRLGMLQWGGVWGNNWLFDPASGRISVCYSNTMREGCNGPFREQLRDAVFG